MLETFLSPGMTPFAVAIALMFIITAVELVGTMMGLSAASALDSLVPEFDIDVDADLDMDIDGDMGASPLDADAIVDGPGPGPLSQLLGWIGIGKVPALVLLVVMLTAYGLAGLAIQSTMNAVTGHMLPAWLASIPAVMIMLPVTRTLGKGLAKVMPKEETEALSARQFIGKVAVITQGNAKAGLAAEAKYTDKFGTSHYLRVEPDASDITISQGTEVIIVSQSGATYKVIENTNTAMSDALNS